MPKFKVEAQSKHAPDQAYAKIKSVLSSDSDLRKMDSDYKCEFNDGKMTGKAKGSKFEADLSVNAKGDGSHVQIEVNLPLMLSPFKGLVQSTLQKKLDTALS